MPWVKLKDQRPEPGQEIIMYLAYYVGINRYRAGRYEGPDKWHPASCAYFPCKDGFGCLLDKEIEAWMPMPSPPPLEAK